ncbi:ornithine/acetylornithine aminotransferase [Gregarina niphandrodes]|uniref:Ornithine aminotransferase n=1 Tax=Gregarina niphandrodes TaxID=110365 RepID=A0A023BC96_GRENI|nr:ornithine/acetylornithine aminotransferase [Gregarina niphandrodes]EZG83119.1 ornithine/acetylornithine aminotransferase [Gregarina niphandrodes]|eukprot:XP_011128953.1 ornithine/acetylornithine aminotransferase [Gregarina niphandrodes]
MTALDEKAGTEKILDETAVEKETVGVAESYMELESQVGAHNYHPMPVVLTRGSGCMMEDVDGRIYFDFLSAYSSINQGHGNSRIVEAMIAQARRLDLTSRAFYNDQLGLAEKLLTETFGYDKALFMNTGVEAVETALKLGRRWAYDVKGIAANEALIVVAENNFHGRTLGVISFSSDPESFSGYGPFLPGFLKVPFGDSQAMIQVIKENSERLAAVLLEPIQGEAGIVVPPAGYLKAVSEACRENNVLLILDEIQTGFGRTGKLLCHYYDDIRPDIICLGKALGGGVYPVSCVLADDPIMLTIRPGQHGSTYGGNPIGSAVAVAAVKEILERDLSKQAAEKGLVFQKLLQSIQHDFPHIIQEVRGRGLLWGVVIYPQFSAWQLCLHLKDLGLLAKPTHDHIIRLAPPLIITQPELHKAADIVRSAVGELEPSPKLTLSN